MKITEKVKNVSYENGTRVATVEKIVSPSYDAEHLGSLYFRLSDIYRRLDNENISEDEKTAIKADLTEVKAEIREYTEYLSGYKK